MRELLILASALSLVACASSSVQPAGGYASYDALKVATEACASKGGHLVLLRNGDARDISDYTCEKTKAGAQ